MKIITASNSAFEPIASLTREANRRAGYDTKCYTVPEIAPPGSKERNCGKAPWKPSIIRQAMLEFRNHIVWLDADAWVIRDISCMERMDYDVAVTMRRPDERGRSDWPDVYGYLNAGVIFFAPTIAACLFIKRWENEVKETPSNSDQHALNNLVRQVTDLTEYDKVFLFEGVRVLVLSTDEYNWYYFPAEPTPDTKILHCKTDLRDRVNLKEWTERSWK